MACGDVALLCALSAALPGLWSPYSKALEFSIKMISILTLGPPGSVLFLVVRMGVERGRHRGSSCKDHSLPPPRYLLCSWLAACLGASYLNFPFPVSSSVKIGTVINK